MNPFGPQIGFGLVEEGDISFDRLAQRYDKAQESYSAAFSALRDTQMEVENWKRGFTLLAIASGSIITALGYKCWRGR